MTATHELEGAIEAVLFVSSEPVRTDRLVELFDVPRERVEAALERRSDGAVVWRGRGRHGGLEVEGYSDDAGRD